MTLGRKAEIEAQTAWWRQQEKWRVEGFNIIQRDPMIRKMNERYRNRKLEELL